MGEEEVKVVCLNCGHVWNSSAKRPQCSICKSTRVEPVEEDVDEGVEESTESSENQSKSVDEFFELDDADVDALIDEDKGKAKPKNESCKLQKIGSAFKSKIGAGALVVGVVTFFALLMLRSIARRRSKKVVNDVLQVEEESFDPYMALG